MSEVSLTQLQAAGFLVITLLNFLFVFLVWRRRTVASFHLGLTALFSGLYSLSQAGVFYFWQIAPGVQFFSWKTTWVGALIIPAFITFFYFFSGNTKYAWLKSLLWYSGGIILFLLSLFTSFIIKGRPVFVPRFFSFNGTTGFLEPLARLYLLLGIIVILTDLIVYYLKAKGIKRLQAKYLILGMSIYAAGSLTVAALIPLIFGTVAFIPLIAYLSFLWVALTVYAFLRYRLMDIRIVLGKGMAYFFSFSIITIAAFLVVFINKKLEFPLSDYLTALIVGFLSIFLFHFTYFYEKIAAKYFYHTFYNAQLVLSELERKLVRILNLEKLSSLILETLLDVLKTEKIAVILADSKSGIKQYKVEKFFGFRKGDLSFLLENSFLAKFIKQKEDMLVLTKEEVRRLNKAENRGRLDEIEKEMESFGIEVILPLLFENEIIGFIILGAKVSGEPFTLQDLNLLTAFSYRASTAFKNAILYNQVSREKEELEKFHKVTVERELKMIELKQKIKALENKLKEKE